MEAGNESQKQREVLRYYAVLWIRTRSDSKLFFGQVGSALGITVPDPNLTFLTKLQLFLQNGLIRL
jgi:hypothetical protein